MGSGVGTGAWKKPGGGTLYDERPASAWAVAAETVGDLVARWGPILVVVLVIVPATALASEEGSAGQYDRMVALLTALGVAAGNVYTAWNTARMKAQIRGIASRRSRPGSRPVLVRRAMPLRSLAAAATVTPPTALGTIERLDARVTGLEASVGAIGRDLGDVKRDLGEVLDLLTGGKRP